MPRRPDLNSRLNVAIKNQPRLIQSEKTMERLNLIKEAALSRKRKQLVLFYRWAITDCFLKYLENILESNRPATPSNDMNRQFAEAMYMVQTLKYEANELWLDYVSGETDDAEKYAFNSSETRNQ